MSRIVHPVHNALDLGGHMLCKFIPQEDITAYELAEILTQISTGNTSLGTRVTIPGYYWDGMDVRIKRHFKVVNGESDA